MSLRPWAFLTLLVLMASRAAAADEWPQFRGPDGQGHSAATGLPETWSENENVAWKTPIAGQGWSSPVVYDRQIWLTTALTEGHSLHALCVDRETGTIVHDIEVFQISQPPNIHGVNSYASPTPVVEPGRVYVHFGTMGTAALDTKTGAVLWRNQELTLDHEVGPGSSPAPYGNLLLLTCDGFDVRYVAAVEKSTGKLAWKTPRSGVINKSGVNKKAFVTPLVIRAGRRDLAIMPGAEWVHAYDPQSGEEIWNVKYPGFSNVPRPVYGHGLVFVCTGYGVPELWAIRPDGEGDITATNVVWKVTKQVPAKPSPILVDDELYIVNDTGIATCLDAKSGKQVWRERFGGNFSASPVAADGRIYFCGEDGKTVVIEAGKKFKQLAVNQLDGRFMASPAIAGKALFLRTDTHLYRIEKQP